uniref:Integrase catalytic domain-containing protein n=1 Tax=Fagus sylvatica TaxID=28930 RepID=A0A2N9HZL1_FAGSY
MLSKPPFPTFAQFVTALQNYSMRFEVADTNDKGVPNQNQNFAFVTYRGGGRGRGRGRNSGPQFNSRGRGFAPANNHYSGRGHHQAQQQYFQVKQQPSQAQQQYFQVKPTAPAQNSELTPNSGAQQHSNQAATCQICGRIGHTAPKCWYRFDYAYETNENLSQALACTTLSSSQNHDSNWYTDTCATSHMTSTEGNLHSSFPYNGHDFVVVGDGSRLPISHVGHTTLSSKYGDLALHDVLPELKKNLISVGKLTQDNSCIFECCSSGFKIKDKYTGQILAMGHKHQGTPEQNGVAERKHRHIVETGLTMLFHARLPKNLWLEAFLTAVYLINRLPSSTIGFLPSQPSSHPSSSPGPSHSPHSFTSSSTPAVPMATPSDLTPILDLTSANTITPTPILESAPTPPSADIATLEPVPSCIVIEPLMPDLQVTALTASPELYSPPSAASCPVMDPPGTEPFVTAPPTSPAQPTPTVSSMVTSTPTINLIPPLTVHTEPSSLPVPLSPSTTSNDIVSPIQSAMRDELTALDQNHTWDLIPRHPGMNIVGSRWVFKTKLKSDGSIERFKARLVAKGYNQLAGLDFLETFSLVIKPTTIRLVLSLAVTCGWSLHQLDVKNAFLHGTLQEVVYMEQPPADSSLFIFRSSHHVILLLVYVDDIILTSNHTPSLNALISRLGSEFSMKDLGSLHYFLGIQVQPFVDGIFLSQQKYAREILARASMSGCKPIGTPLAQKLKLQHEGGPLVDATNYRSIVAADWAGCPDTRRSTTGYCIYLGANCISWASKKQATVSRSSAEAEYRAMASATAELTWLTYLMRDLGISPSTTPTLFCDNTSALHMTVNPVFHARTKHSELDFHFVEKKLLLVPSPPVISLLNLKLLISSLRPFPRTPSINFDSSLACCLLRPPACGGLIRISPRISSSRSTTPL